jgi:hypothetical protein
VGRVVPAKLFEYFAARKPILTIAPRGERWDLREGGPVSHRREPADVEGIAGFLAGQLALHAGGGAARPEAADWDVSGFGRKAQAGQLAELLDDLLADGKHPAGAGALTPVAPLAPELTRI